MNVFSSVSNIRTMGKFEGNIRTFFYKAIMSLNEITFF